MAIRAKLNYIEFHNTKDKLEPGYYRVIEADGDINIAKVERRSWERNATITWMSEQDHYHNVIMERDITEALRGGEDEFRRIDPLDLAEHDEDDIPGTDSREMSDAQYDALCAVTDQNRRDGVI